MIVENQDHREKVLAGWAGAKPPASAAKQRPAGSDSRALGLGTERISKRRSIVNQLRDEDGSRLQRDELARRLGTTSSAIRGTIRGDHRHGNQRLEKALLEELKKAQVDVQGW